MKARIISGTALVVLFAAIVIFNNSFPLALNIAVALISVAAVFEIIQALGYLKKVVLVIPSLLFSAVLPFLQETYLQQAATYIYMVVLFASLICYHKEITFREVGVIYSMTIIIPTSLVMLTGIRTLGGYHGMFYVMIAVFSAWIADVGGFFAGTFFGKHKLCPEISPKKTVEGVIGGFVLNIAAMLVFGFIFSAVYYQKEVEVSYLALGLIGFGSTIMSILGDLSFSLIKRSCHIKDFGELIPGHGGILDRFDSVIFVTPFVYFLLTALPIVVSSPKI